ncbi:GNAT family N-acetyltransferase [Tomitella biformata]|uniref:GNAT family N-acetyltransferase n=1 Tax=Tomitella biformata TaxID=630403 RepID=UPI000467B37D|nr:GNAT family N-acetyltransferase [Tomitella biformata]
MIRRVAPADVPAIVELIYGLAEYERLRHECTATPEQVHAALFCEQPAVFGHVAVEDGAVVGMALWFLTFSTWDGVHGIHLEDLYVLPERRGQGHGALLLGALAQVCVERGYTRLEWEVLDWNAPAIGFYESIGAGGRTEWTNYRLTGNPLHALAAGGR